jgi:DNA-binding response OmpR family regulator
VLVVEDDASLAEFVHDLLAGEGYEVRRAESVDLAQATLAHWIPDLVLLDLNLPGRPGDELLGDYRRFSEFPLPVIVLSALPEAPAIATRIGAVGCVTKPFDSDALVAQVEQAIASRSGS